MSNDRYVRELGGVLVVYAVLLVGAITALDHVDGWLKIPIALIPMIPASFVPWVVLRRLRGLDELQRRIQLEALGFAFAGTAVITFGWGFLELAGVPRMPTFAVWPVMAALWGLGIAASNRRFR
ncbi:MAG: hypothetical protein R3F59_27820 [Myxococcota bacterium]